MFVPALEEIDAKLRAALLASGARIIAASGSPPEATDALTEQLRDTTIAIPPLRERSADIPRLARIVVLDLVREEQIPARPLALTTLEVLRRHGWARNVAGLRDALRAALGAAREARVVEPEHLPEPIRRGTPSLDVVAVPVGTVLEEAERALIERTIAAVSGKKKEAARLLGISRSALYAKLDRYAAR
jgi:DNA-binding NtrC family response regulator